MRIQNEDIDRFTVPASFARGRSCIAGRRTHDRHALALPRENMVEKTADQLHWIVFKRQRRTVEQFHQPKIGFELFQRSHGGMHEPFERLLDNAGKRRRLDPPP